MKLSPSESRAPLGGQLVDRLMADLCPCTECHDTPDAMEAALKATCAESHALRLPPEAAVLALKTAWARTPQPPYMTDDEWSHRYFVAITACLSAYFE
jgi:hypothetical protein